MKINAIKCKKCGYTIFSRARHDFRSCKCGKISMDGGFEYIRIMGESKLVESVILNIKQTKLELYKDWNNYKDKYGLIEPIESKCKKCSNKKCKRRKK